MESRTRYDNVTKDCWRRWVWNRMKERLPKSSRVLVLCGECGKDFDVAKEKGLEAVGIDINGECVTSFRRRGGVALKERYDRAAIYMAGSVQGAIIDQLGGVTRQSIHNVVNSLHCSVIAANYLRGRDKRGSEWCSKLIEHGVYVYEWNTGRPKRRSLEDRHRGVLMLCLLIGGILDRLSDDSLLWDQISKYGEDAAFYTMCKVMRPCFYSYRSSNGGLIYDSVLFNNSGAVDVVNAIGSVHSKLNGIAYKRARRKAAAAKALLTMRRNSST